MGLKISRSVRIDIFNSTQNVTLRNPRTYFYSGHSIKSPQALLPPGSSDTCKFTNSSVFWGCNGVLAFEAESFTMAIFFSNPIDHNLFSVEVGLELSLDKAHRTDLEECYNRLVRNTTTSSNQNFMFPFVITSESQEEAELSAGPVKVTVTVSRGRNAIIMVEVEEQKNSDDGDKKENRCRPRHVQEE